MTAPRLQAPKENGGVLAEPGLGEVGPQLAVNRERLTQSRCTILGRPLAELRRHAAQATLTAACAYLQQAGEPFPQIGSSTALFMAGHQPELFHPGVWVKNFALHGLARAHGATGINLVVDNDTVKNAALRLPVPDPEKLARLAMVPFDRWEGEVPYEERTVHDEALFAGFADRAGAVLREWPLETMLPEFWAEVRHQAERTPLLGERFAAARRTFERRWGCHNLEVPVSYLCRTEPFAWFACDLLGKAATFHTIYNDCVRAYRRQHGIRSRNHPVPDLAEEDGWWEVPFWAWRAGTTRRLRLWVRPTGAGLELRAGGERWPTLPRAGVQQVAAWLDLEPHGFRVRNRALTTTLCARLLIADLFIHGIGGAKYDELTDEILHRFYGVEPPGYLTLSATLWLPLPAWPLQPERRGRLVRELRDFHYNPQRFVGQAAATDGAAQRLIAEKQAWIDRQPADPAGKRERFETLRRLNEQLRPYLPGRERAVQEELDRWERVRAANAVLRRRDYAFCLYPEAQLRPFCTRFL